MISNRRELIAAAGAGLIAAPAFAQVSGAAVPRGAPTATTRSGQIYGATRDGVHAFKGVRYGAPTRRFIPPEPPAAWASPAAALDFGNSSPQMGAERPSVYASWANPKPESEDCRFLNVYTPGLRDGGRRPVMVWFHGGGYTSGSGSSNYMDGTRLCRRGDVVVVTVNHRLNAFGFTYLAHLDPALADSGNVGAMDMAQALRWVRDNIREFGGDPNTVMIFGQSGGGGKVSTLLAAPAAEGLFHRAVVQSGSGITSITTTAAEASTGRLLTALNLPATAAGARQLAAMPQARLSAALPGANVSFGPVLDFRFIQRHPFQPDAPSISRNVPMLIGCTTDETASLVGGRDETLFSLTWDTLPGRLSPNIGGRNVTRIVSELRRIYPQKTPPEIYWTATSEVQFRTRSILQAERKAAQAAAGGAKPYMYLFAWQSPVDGGKWHAPHSVEHAFVFDNVAVSESMVGRGAAQDRLAATVSSAWIRFALTGNPGWAAYTTTKRSTMMFDDPSRVVDDPRGEQRRLFATA